MALKDTRLARLAKFADDWDVDEESSLDFRRSPTVNPSPEQKDFRDYLAVVLRRKWLILSLVLIATSAAVIYAFSLPLRYEALARLRVQPRTFTFTGEGHGVVFQSSDNYDYVNTQIILLSNPQLIRQVVARLDLQNNPKFLSEPRQAGFALGLRQLFSRAKAAPSPIESAPVAKTAFETGLTETFTAEQTLRMEPYVSAIISNLKVEQEKYSNLINIRFTHTNPELAMKVIETIADTFVAQDSKYETAGTRKAMETLAQQIAALETGINETEAKRLLYLKTHNLPLGDGK
jgi:succinoglycan biosynthesis transport protein ExoP